MMKFTTLQHLIETGFDVGLDSYEIFDESYRDTLNNKIIDEYYLREVNGTADAFKFYINRAMSQIMPYYNKLYESDLVKLDPFIKRKLEELREKNSTTIIDQDQSTTQDLDNDTSIINKTALETIDNRVTDNTINQDTDTINSQNAASTKTDSADDLSIGSKTPQSQLLAGDITSNLYADEATKQQSSLTSESEDSSSINENVSTEKAENVVSSGTIQSDTDSDSTQHSETDNTTVLENDTTTTLTESESYKKDEFDISGLDLLEKYKDTLYNIDIMIVMDQKIKDCFMQVYF